MDKHTAEVLATGCVFNQMLMLHPKRPPSPWEMFALTGRVSRQQAVCALYFHPVYWRP